MPDRTREALVQDSPSLPVTEPTPCQPGDALLAPGTRDGGTSTLAWHPEASLAPRAESAGDNWLGSLSGVGPAAEFQTNAPSPVLSWSGCPSLAVWQAALAQGLSTAEDQACVQHAETCTACQQLLEQLVGTDRSHRLLAAAAAGLETPHAGRTVMWHHPPATDLYGTVTPHPSAGVSPPVPAVPGYELLQELGRGGMGVVYLARHVALNRQVALKMILGGARAAPGDLARFRAEAEAVAKFTHPHIVQIYDVGTLEGVPYCALELIPGGNLEEKLRGQPQPPREAAALLIPVAEAVQAAHDQGILHRDLKPSNILLTPEGSPKLTDFGLAKRLAEDSGHTRTGDIVGTPSYMAPEQAAGKIKQLGPAVDIYALGAILYHMLTGRPPFQGLSAMDTVLQVMTTEPVPPSHLQPTVPRELETICLKCLHKEPAQRYLTASALAGDLQNYLAGKPITARPASRWERLVKWCRRYPTAAALMLVVTVAAGGMAGLAAWALAAERQAQANEQLAQQNEQKALQESAQKEAQRRKAVEQAELAQSVLGFLRLDVLHMADPRTQREDQLSSKKFDAEVKLRDVLLRAGQAIEGKFATQPAVEMELRWTLGHTFMAMGRADLAVGHLERMRTLVAKHYDPHDPAVFNCLTHLANSYQALGRSAQALQLHEEILAAQKKALGPDHPDTLNSQHNVAVCYSETGRNAEAQNLLEVTLARQKVIRGPDHPDTLGSQYSLAGSYLRQRRYAEATPLYADCLARRKERLGPNHPDTLSCMASLGTSYLIAGRNADALPLFEEAVGRRKTVLGVEHPDTLDVMMSLASCYHYLGRSADALKVNQEARTARERLAARDQTDLTNLLNLGGLECNIGHALARLGQLSESLTTYENALARLHRVHQQQPNNSTPRFFLINTYMGRARAYESLQRYTEADADWDKALELSAQADQEYINERRNEAKAKRKSPDGTKP